ncbi:MAG: starch-binding protein [Oscillospiraceae bacterium]|nr:starch-binding protein [Oscillospiraceae bacterium]
MKRILAFICVMACLLGLSLPAMAAPEGMITVTAEVPADWTNVHLYAWVDDTNSLVTWPGTPMVKGDDGRYTLEIPMEYPNIIVNNGEGAAQTQDMSFDGVSDVWVIVSGGSGEVVYYDPGVGAGSQGGGSEAGELTSVALVGEGIGDLKWEPENADLEMTKDGEGIWTKDLTLYKGTTIKFKLCGNDSWDSGYNFGASAPDMALTAGTAAELVNGSSDNLTYTASQDCTLTVTLDMNGDVPSLTVTETAATLEPAPEVEKVKVYVSLPEGITPNLWAWGDNGDAFPSWPGQAMTKDGDWWVIEIPNNCHSAIVNDGTTQTTDLSINLGADSWIVVDASWTATVSATEPSVTPGGNEQGNEQPTTKPTEKPEPTQPTEKPEDTTTEDKPAENEGGVDVFMIITIVMAVLAVGAVVVTVVILKKKG